MNACYVMINRNIDVIKSHRCMHALSTYFSCIVFVTQLKHNQSIQTM